MIPISAVDRLPTCHRLARRGVRLAPRRLALREPARYETAEDEAGVPSFFPLELPDPSLPLELPDPSLLLELPDPSLDEEDAPPLSLEEPPSFEDPPPSLAALDAPESRRAPRPSLRLSVR
jgi:hypothetical protein